MIKNINEESGLVEPEEQIHFRHYCSSYFTLPPSEIAPVTSKLDAATRALAHLRSVMQRCQKGIHILEPRVSAYSAVIAPWRRLPTETLTSIFRLAIGIPDGKAAWERTIVEERATTPATILMRPLIIAAVCRRWRDIMLATPALWSFLMWDDTFLSEISFISTIVPQPNRPTVGIQEQLRRSKGADLCIIICDLHGTCAWPGRPRLAQSVRDVAYLAANAQRAPHTQYKTPVRVPLLSLVAHRIRYMHVPATSLRELQGRVFPRLSYLSAEGPEPTSTGEDCIFINWKEGRDAVISGANLRHLKILYHSRLNDLTAQTLADIFPWHQLTTSSIEVWSVDDLMSQMRQMSSSIVSLELKVKIGYDKLVNDVQAQLNQGATIRLHKLKSLRLRGNGALKILDLVASPSLRYLDIIGSSTGLKPLYDLISRSSCSFTSLRIAVDGVWMAVLLPELRRRLSSNDWNALLLR